MCLAFMCVMSLNSLQLYFEIEFILILIFFILFNLCIKNGVDCVLISVCVGMVPIQDK